MLYTYLLLVAISSPRIIAICVAPRHRRCRVYLSHVPVTATCAHFLPPPCRAARRADRLPVERVRVRSRRVAAATYHAKLHQLHDVTSPHALSMGRKSARAPLSVTAAAEKYHNACWLLLLVMLSERKYSRDTKSDNKHTTKHRKKCI